MVPLIIAGGIGLLLLAATRKGKAVKIHDRRKNARLTEYAAKHTRPRDASQIDGVTLHQMGFSRGSDPKRYDKVTAHYVVLPDGAVYQLHDHTERLPASSSLNGRTIAIEFAGNFPSRAGSTDPKAFWSGSKFGMDQLTPEQVLAGRALLAHLQKTAGVRNVFAHRQGGAKRENDPGPDVWREIAGWAVQTQGMGWGGPGWSIGNGKPIPDAWWKPKKAVA